MAHTPPAMAGPANGYSDASWPLHHHHDAHALGGAPTHSDDPGAMLATAHALVMEEMESAINMLVDTALARLDACGQRIGTLEARLADVSDATDRAGSLRKECTALRRQVEHGKRDVLAVEALAQPA